MPSFSDIREALERIREGIEHIRSEDELEKLFLSAGFYEALGYKTVGRDIRGKVKGQGGIPDVLLVNEDESIQVVLEFKRPSEEPASYSEQLLVYARELRPPYALLTNGRTFLLYRRRENFWEVTGHYTLDQLIQDPSPLSPLGRATLDLRDPSRVLEALKRSEEEQIPLEDPHGEGGRQFLLAFGLAKEGGEPAKDIGELGPFGQLVDAAYRLVRALRERSRFLEGAYDFWKKVYAQKPEEVPKTWKVFGATGGEDLYSLMFALQTAYALTARLILAKVVEDYGGHPRLGSLSQNLIHELEDPLYKASIPPWAYPEAIQRVFDKYARHFLPSLYASDLFDWWREAPRDEEATHRFGEALGRTLLALFRFHFGRLKGDFLGELYQAYFDPETRKALGEFYTPPAVVDFILDQVGYQGEGRLLDPACGSGTFLIHALRRFIRGERQKGSSPLEILRKLTEDYTLVGFDINPFAVMMSQVNLVSHLVDIYLKALNEEPELVLRHLPVVQTDSLRQELFEGITLGRHAQVGLNFGEKEVTLKVPLPIKGEAPEAEVTFPNPEWAVGSGLVRNLSEWILALEALFEAVYQRNQEVEKGWHPTPWGTLLIGALRRTKLPPSLAPELETYAKKIWVTLEKLRPEHGDGRFIKALTDFALGMVLKHVIQYRYVVGNPPYVRIQHLPEFQKEHWRNAYTWVEGNFDIFIPFTERAFQSQRGEKPGWLEEGGRLGFVTSNRFLNANYAIKLREDLPKRAKLLALVDLGAATFNAVKGEGGERPFKEATVYPAIFAWENQKPESSYAFPAARFLPKEVPLTLQEALEQVKGALSQLGEANPHIPLEGCYGDVFLAQSAWLWPRGWYIMPPGERAVWEKIDRIGRWAGVDPGSDTVPPEARRLINFTATTSGGFQGIVTGRDEVLVLKQVGEDKDRGLLFLVPKGQEGNREAQKHPVAIEKEVLRPFLFGRDVDRWHLSWKGYWVIFPYWYGQVGNKKGWHLIPTKENLGLEPYSDWPKKAPLLDRDYPHLWAYLKAHEAELRAREGGKYQAGKPEAWRWYDLARPQSLEAATRPKILLQTMAKRPEFALDEWGFLFAGSGGANAYGLLVKESVNRKVIVAIANSNVSYFYIKNISPIFSGGYISYGDQSIKWLPIPEIPDEEAEVLSKLVDDAIQAAAEMHHLQSFREGLPHTLLEALKARGKAPPRDSVGNLAREEGALAGTLQADRAHLGEDLYGRVLLRIGRGTLVFEHRAHAELVLTILKERGEVSKEELLGWEIPLAPEEAKEWTEGLKQLPAYANELGKLITSLEEQIDGRVVQLYGLEQGDVEVIENQLLKFEQCASAEEARPLKTRHPKQFQGELQVHPAAAPFPLFNLPNPFNTELLEYVCPEDGCETRNFYPQVPPDPGHCPVHRKKLIPKKR